MANKFLRILSILSATAALTACGKAEFDPGITGTKTPVLSEELSTIIVSEDNVADGITPAEITVQIMSTAGNPMAGMPVNLQVSGYDNVIVPCSISDANGRSRCRVYSTFAEVKTLSFSGSVSKLKQVNFKAPQPLRSSFAIVSGASNDVLPTGERIVASAGIIESDIILRDVDGVIRAQSSILGTMIQE